MTSSNDELRSALRAFVEEQIARGGELGAIGAAMTGHGLAIVQAVNGPIHAIEIVDGLKGAIRASAS